MVVGGMAIHSRLIKVCSIVHICSLCLSNPFQNYCKDIELWSLQLQLLARQLLRFLPPQVDFAALLEACIGERLRMPRDYLSSISHQAFINALVGSKTNCKGTMLHWFKKARRTQGWSHMQ